MKHSTIDSSPQTEGGRRKQHFLQDSPAFTSTLLSTFVCTVLGLVLLASPIEAEETQRYPILCTTGMIGDVVKLIAGDRAEVQTLIGSGIDPHLYKPTRSDIAALLKAEIIFYNGLLLEGKMTDAIQRAAKGGRKVYAVAEQIDSQFLLGSAEFEESHDPHLWMDPVAWSAVADLIAEKLVEHDPEAESIYRANAEKLGSELADLHRYSESVLASIPKENRILVTAHDAFNYFARRYGIEVMGIQGISTESEAGVQDIERIVKAIVERRIRAVFVESTVSDRNVRALVEGAKAQGHELSIAGNLFSDAMGRAGTYEGTYQGMIDHNVTQIARALGGTAPARGKNNRLTMIAD